MMLSRWQSTIVDAQGNVQPHAVLRIRKEQDQSLALVYRSNSDLQPYPLGLVAADINGFAYFYAPPGRYRIQSIDLDIDWRDVEIGALSTARAALEHSGMTIYDTHADMMADAPSESPVYARVVNDADPDLNGYYIWDSSSWERTTAQPADAENVLYRNVPQSAPLLHDIPQSGVVQLPYDLDSLQAAVRVLQYGVGPYPTLDLIFAGAQLLDPRVEFTRASTATGTGPIGRIYTAAIDEPRFVYDPVTGKSEGLLVEGQATNLLEWSNSFDPAHHGNTLTNATFTADAAISPSGNNDATRIVETAEDDVHLLQKTIGVFPDGGELTASVILKPVRVTEVRLRCGRYGLESAIIDLSSGDVRSVGHNVLDAGLEPLSDGWVRAYVTANVSAATQNQFLNMVFLRNGTDVYPGDGETGLYVWHAQAEEGLRMTSPIYTAGSQVTRAADDAVIPVGDWFNPDEGTFVVDYVHSGINFSNPLSLNVTPSAGNPRLLVRGGTSTVLMDGAAFLGESTTPIASGLSRGDRVKAAISYDIDALVARGCALGGDVQSTAIINPDVEFAYLMIGTQRTTTGYLNEPIRRITYYPRALSDAELQALTS